jgi:hypothetical protein
MNASSPSIQDVFKAIHCTGEIDCTGAGNVETGEEDCTERVKQVAHELSNELPRTIDAHHVEAGGPDRSLRRSLTGALRDPVPKRERTEVIQDRIAKRLPDGWNTLGALPEDVRDRLTELEAADTFLSAVLLIADIVLLQP